MLRGQLKHVKDELKIMNENFSKIIDRVFTLETEVSLRFRVNAYIKFMIYFFLCSVV